MPGKDGLQLAREIRQHQTVSNIRIVVLTSLFQRGHAEQARQAGAMGYLPKPVQHDHLHECLRKVLGISCEPGLAQQQAAHTPPPLLAQHPPAGTLSNPRILIIEDNNCLNSYGLSDARHGRI